MDYPMGYLFSWSMNKGATMFQINQDTQLWEELVVPMCEEFYGWLSKCPHNLDTNVARFKRGEKSNNQAKVFASMIQNTFKTYPL